MNDLYKTILCEKVARLFEMVDYNVILFPEMWLKSEINRKIIEMNPAIISQSTHYWLECFLENISIPKTVENVNKDAMFWLGYILTYIQFETDMPGDVLWDKYNIPRVLACYDVLHTVSNKVASEMIRKDFLKSNEAEMQVFGECLHDK